MSLFICISGSVYIFHSRVSPRAGQTPSSDSCSAPFSSSPLPHFDLLFTRWWHKAPRMGAGGRGERRWEDPWGDHLRAAITQNVQCTYLNTQAHEQESRRWTIWGRRLRLRTHVDTYKHDGDRPRLSARGSPMTTSEQPFTHTQIWLFFSFLFF